MDKLIEIVMWAILLGFVFLTALNSTKLEVENEELRGKLLKYIDLYYEAKKRKSINE